MELNLMKRFITVAESMAVPLAYSESKAIVFINMTTPAFEARFRFAGPVSASFCARTAPNSNP